MAGFNFFGGGGAKPAAGGAGSSPGAGAGAGAGDEEDLTIPDGGQGEEQELNPGDLLANFFPGESEDEGDDGNEDGESRQGGNPPAKKQKGAGGGGDQELTDDERVSQNLASEIHEMIERMSIDDKVLGEDFDPNDPAKFKNALTQVMQKTAVASMQLTMKPMQVAMQNMMLEMKNQIQESLANFGSQQGEYATLQRIVPEVNSKEYGPMVQGLFKQAMKQKGATADKAAHAVRKALDGFGIRSKGGDSGGDAFTGGFRTGESALDAFAPIPRPKKG